MLLLNAISYNLPKEWNSHSIRWYSLIALYYCYPYMNITKLYLISWFSVSPKNGCSSLFETKHTQKILCLRKRGNYNYLWLLLDMFHQQNSSHCRACIHAPDRPKKNFLPQWNQRGPVLAPSACARRGQERYLGNGVFSENWGEFFLLRAPLPLHRVVEKAVHAVTEVIRAPSI